MLFAAATPQMEILVPAYKQMFNDNKIKFSWH